MGLYVQSLESLPREAERNFYIYLLDYGWHEPLGEALNRNFEKMAREAEKANAVVITSNNRVHFEDQVLSWHSVNGMDTNEILPAILITNRNPHKFKERFSAVPVDNMEKDLKLILIPLRKFCSNTTDVARLIDNLFRDIVSGKQLAEFKIGKEIPKGGRSLADAVLLEPSHGKSGIPIEDVINFFKGYTHPKIGLAKTVHPIHFEDFSGEQFERLVYAYVYRTKNWTSLEWLGQTGSDGGRDIWGLFDNYTYCYQCANYKQLVFKKISDDIDKLINARTIPYCFTVVAGGPVSPQMRKRISLYANSLGISRVVIWSGVELEEMIRRDHPELIKRFFGGEPFPELETDLEILELINGYLDRPAFTTPFRRESSVGDFEVALSDTIAVLNTGVHRLRDGTIIKIAASKHEIKDGIIKESLVALTQKIIDLRDKFVQFKLNQNIKPCECDQGDCPVWFFSDEAIHTMDEIRKSIIVYFKEVYPKSTLKFQRE